MSGLVGLIALLGIIRPAMLFEYPTAISMLMWFFIIPQARKIEAIGEFSDYEPTTTWTYIILCVMMIIAGFHIGSARRSASSAGSITDFRVKYNVDKLIIGATTLVGVGIFALVLASREVAVKQNNDAWTGPLAFYAMLSMLVIYGASLGWLLYLYTGSKKALSLALIGLTANLPTVLFSAKREAAFTMAAVFFLGLFFVRKKSINRLILVPLILFGGILVNQAGTIRGYISTNNSSLVGAITSDEIITKKSDEKRNFNETASAVSDIAIANWSGEYEFFGPYVNTLIQLYVPAFIVGHDLKDALKFEIVDPQDDVASRYYAPGATRTGFADSFQSLHFFGCFVFFAISYAMGFLWKGAIAGSIMSQLYYILLLAAGLKSVTESTSIFVGALPLIFGSTWLVLRYARISSKKASVAIMRHTPQRPG